MATGNRMETLFGAGIAQRIRALSDDASRFVSIVSPYIGRWPAICRILGGSWWLGSPLTLRTITDISTPHNVNAGTLKRLMNRGQTRSLPGVHAKVYIFDDQAVVTSANLTETAFTKRYEIGTYLDSTEAQEVIKRFDFWWEASTPDLTEDIFSSWTAPESEFASEMLGSSLKLLWSLPEKPNDALFIEPEQNVHKKFKSFQQFVSFYKELADSYSKLQRLWEEAPLFLEVDSFLNYLFHEAPGKPSFAFFGTDVPRTLSPGGREAEIAKHAANFKQWALSKPNERWREGYSGLIQHRLAKDHIGSLKIEEAKEVVDRLNCMNARQLNKYKFLRPHNNDIYTIRNAWKNLLFGTGTLQNRMETCDASLRFFGPSSVQELLGWFFPGDYPIRNNNSDAGLRFFGFKV